MGVEGLRWVQRGLGGGRVLEMSVESQKLMWRALNGRGGTEMGLKGVRWVRRA